MAFGVQEPRVRPLATIEGYFVTPPPSATRRIYAR